MIRVTVLSILTLALVVSCSSSKRQYSNDEWEYAIRVLLDLNPDEDTTGNEYSHRVKMLKTNEEWFFVIVNTWDDSTLLYSYVGYLDRISIKYSKLKKGEILVKSDIIEMLVEKDSLWTLFVPNEKFNDNKFYDSLYKESTSYGSGGDRLKMSQGSILKDYFK